MGNVGTEKDVSKECCYDAASYLAEIERIVVIEPSNRRPKEHKGRDGWTKGGWVLRFLFGGGDGYRS
jgi:hypothetical protein